MKEQPLPWRVLLELVLLLFLRRRLVTCLGFCSLRPLRLLMPHFHLPIRFRFQLQCRLQLRVAVSLPPARGRPALQFLPLKQHRRRQQELPRWPVRLLRFQQEAPRGFFRYQPLVQHP